MVAGAAERNLSSQREDKTKAASSLKLMTRLGVTPDPIDLLSRLSNYDRSVFMEMLAEALHEKPTPSAIKAFADKQPDRFAQYVTQIAKLSGFNDKLEVDIGFKAILQLSDAEKLALIKQYEAQQIDVSPEQTTKDQALTKV